jgi:hypothetical protein
LTVADRDMKVSHAFVPSSVRVAKLTFRLQTRVRAPVLPDYCGVRSPEDPGP